MTLKTDIAGIWKFGLTSILGVTIAISSWAFSSTDARVRALEDARVPQAAAEAALQNEVANLSRRVQELSEAVRELNRRLDNRPLAPRNP